HRRFRHAGITRINRAVNLVTGLEFKDSDIQKCEDCTIANHKRRPFDAEQDVEEDPLERVYVDIFGPTRVSSIGGNLYAMVVIDGGTSKKTSYFLSNRTAETTLQYLNDFKTKAE
ncbi:hypothetical protein F5878DRAFT_492939, partial [Lentinula raphanica]